MTIRNSVLYKHSNTPEENVMGKGKGKTKIVMGSVLESGKPAPCVREFPVTHIEVFAKEFLEVHMPLGYSWFSFEYYQRIITIGRFQDTRKIEIAKERGLWV